jgi:poly-gamma-glutamate capsule biosynthesis protein CapA/YwtB (metallophosphatase superfamily)
MHASVFQQALSYGGGRRYDFQPMFRRLARYVKRADLALCHVETPFRAGPPRGYPVFFDAYVPGTDDRQDGLGRLRYSNHSLDAGQQGIDSTIAALHRAGVRHTGSYRSPRASRRPLVLTASGVGVSLLAYTETTNGRRPPRPWSLNLAEPRRILTDARRARRRGAQVVLVNVHWGRRSTPHGRPNDSAGWSAGWHAPLTSRRYLDRARTSSGRFAGCGASPSSSARAT